MEPVNKIVTSSKYAALAALLQTAKAHTHELFVVLAEDTYETSSGDGEFHYFDYLSETESEAREYIAAMSAATDAGSTRHHVRRLHLTLDGECIRYDLQVEVFDHCDVPKMLSAANRLAGRISQNG